MDSKLMHIVEVGVPVQTTAERSLGSLHFALLAALIAAPALIACNQAAAPASSPKPKAADTQPATVNPATTPSVTTPTETAASFSIELEDSSNELKFEVAKPLEVAFTLKGADNVQAIVGLSELPAGGKMTRTGTRLTFSWDAPTNGDQNVRFLIRNRPACVAAESDATACAMKEADFGSLTKKNYDTESQTFTLHVGSGTGTGTNTGTGSLIQQIVALLGKSGAGGAGGAAGIQGLLSSLSQGQLTQLLGSLKNGGAGAAGAGGFDISQVLGLLQGGFNLQDAPPLAASPAVGD